MGHCSRGWRVLACITLASMPAAVRVQEIVGSWTVEYRTTALKVEAVEEALPVGNTRLVTVRLRNTSATPITAIAADIEDGRGRFDWAESPPVKPGETTELRVNNKVRAEPYRHVRVNSVLFADKGPDDGDRSTAQVLRFGRLGHLLEEERCLGLLNRLDPSRLDDASVSALLASVSESPKTLDEALSLLPESPHFKAGSHERIRGASADARGAFLLSVGFRRGWCNDEVRKVAQLSASAGEERALRREIEKLARQHQRAVDRLGPLCERDMEAEQ